MLLSFYRRVALARWQAAGVDTSALKNMQVSITDLGGNTLGEVKANTIWLNDNAVGCRF